MKISCFVTPATFPYIQLTEKDCDFINSELKDFRPLEISWWSEMKKKNHKIFDVIILLVMCLRQGIQPRRIQEMINKKVVIGKTRFLGWALSGAIKNIGISSEFFSPKMMKLLECLIPEIQNTEIREEALVYTTNEDYKAPYDIIGLVGCSGSGKSMVKKSLVEQSARYKMVTCVTTRAPRSGEQNGGEKTFVDTATFTKMKLNGEFVALEKHNKSWYGFTWAEINKNIIAEKVSVLDFKRSMLKDFKMVSNISIMAIGLKFENTEAGKKALEKRVTTTKETPKDIQERVDLLGEDIKFLEDNKRSFSKIFVIEENDNYVSYYHKLAKKIV